MNKLLIIALLFPSACATVNVGPQLDRESLSFIQPGITTESDLVQHLGAPNSVQVLADGGKALTFLEIHSSASGMNASLLNPFYTRIDSETKTESCVVTVGKDGIVTGSTYYGVD